jgi:hypothetical protein
MPQAQGRADALRAETADPATVAVEAGRTLSRDTFRSAAVRWLFPSGRRMTRTKNAIGRQTVQRISLRDDNTRG